MVDIVVLILTSRVFIDLDSGRHEWLEAFVMPTHDFLELEDHEPDEDYFDLHEPKTFEEVRISERQNLPHFHS